MLGKLLDERYQIIQILSAGGFGQTYIAEDTRRVGNPKCVVKHLKPANSDPYTLQVSRRLFYSEAETLEKVGDHSQIPRPLAYFEEDGEFYLVQDFIEGNPLSREIIPGQPWSDNQVMEMLQDVLGILQFIHDYNVIHRDLKPDNLIRRQKDGKLVLIDFGAVKQVRSQMIANPTQATATVAIGTPGYMPAEQQIGKPRTNSDIYALGIIAIQALTGLYPTELQEDPQTGEIRWQNYTQVSDRLAAIISQMVRYDHRKDRYQSASDVLDALQQLVNPFPATQPNSYGYPLTQETSSLKYIPASNIAVPDLVRYVFKATNLGQKDLGVPQLLRKHYKAFSQPQVTPASPLQRQADSEKKIVAVVGLIPFILVPIGFLIRLLTSVK
jgi:eukaryotic-like serine/threonine-protein kinase